MTPLTHELYGAVACLARAYGCAHEMHTPESAEWLRRYLLEISHTLTHLALDHDEALQQAEPNWEAIAREADAARTREIRHAR